MNTLYWLTNDLRIADNPALVAAASSDTLTCVYCIDEKDFHTDRFGNRRIGEHRWRFLRESLLEMSQALSSLGQTLHILEGPAASSISQLLNSGPYHRVVRTRQHAADEAADWGQLQTEHPDVTFDEIDGATLLTKDDIVFDKFPATFSRFRRSIEKVGYRSRKGTPQRLPEPISIEPDSRLIERPEPVGSYRGGFSSGHEHLQRYFNTRAPSTYKETRNSLQGEHTSTGFSPWLAHGCLSPVEIIHQLRDYESEYGANESTEWIEFELLWREFFSWYGRHHGNKLFRFEGISGARPLTTFYRERFIKWCNGETPWPIVNACMNELNATGFLSNRGRQIAASCLVNELELDWRCGAGYFEQQLIDYDPCSNWGNWQYIAGVGADPRGGRHFNIEKQATTWDADGEYRRTWAGSTPTTPLDSMDYYGWPVEASRGTP